MLKIDEIELGQPIDYVEGKITKMGKSRKWNNQDILNAFLCDDTGVVKISFWGEHSQKFSNNDCISIRNARETMISGQKNITVLHSSITEKIQKEIICKTDMPDNIKFLKINDLKTLTNYVNVKGKISEKKIGETQAEDGKQFEAHAKLCDETGVIGLTLWREDAQKYDDGDCIEITGGHTTELNGTINLSGGRYGHVEKIIEEITCTEQENKIKFKKINELKFIEKNVNVQGKLTIKRIINDQGDPCLQGKLCDDTKSILVTLWKGNATKFSNGDNIQIVSGRVTVLREPVLTEGHFGTVSLIEKNINCKSEDHETKFKPEESGVI